MNAEFRLRTLMNVNDVNVQHIQGYVILTEFTPVYGAKNNAKCRDKRL